MVIPAAPRRGAESGQARVSASHRHDPARSRPGSSSTCRRPSIPRSRSWRPSAGFARCFSTKDNGIQPRDEAVDAALEGPGRLRRQECADAPVGRARTRSRSITVGRVPLLRAVVKASKNPDEQLAFNKQVVDSLVAAVRTGRFAARQETARPDHRRRRQARLLRGLQLDRRRVCDE